jgi:2-oxoglutarate dehydrogenase complex dehydrogenase (E1) component-like enzyme
MLTYQPIPSFTVSSEALESRIKQSNFYQFVTAYRQHGHKKANINPIAITQERFVSVYVRILHYDGSYSFYSQKITLTGIHLS